MAAAYFSRSNRSNAAGGCGTLGAVALPITPELVKRVAGELGEGGWRFSLRQLYYAVCAEAEIPPTHAAANGEIALGALLAVVALILIRFRVVFAALLGLGAVLIVAGVVQRLTSRPPEGRVLVMSYAEFESRFGGIELDSLVDIDAKPDLRPPGSGIAVVCDSEETARVLAANLDTAGLNDVVPLDAESLPTPIPWRAVAALHDASPRGCALPLELHEAGVDVIDCGLRPGWVDAPTSQVLEGAPARMPRELRPLLDEDEVSWLASGRRVELATLPPPRPMALLKAALAGGAGRLPGVRGFVL